MTLESYYYNSEYQKILKFIAEEINKSIKAETIIWELHPTICIYEKGSHSPPDNDENKAFCFITMGTDYTITLTTRTPISINKNNIVYASPKSDTILYRGSIYNPNFMRDILTNLKSIRK